MVPSLFLILLLPCFLFSLALCFLSSFFSFRVLALLLGLALVYTLSALGKRRFRGGLRRLCQGLCIALVLFVGAMGLWFGVVCLSIARTESLPPQGEVDFVVVLGAKIQRDRPSAILAKRLNTALDYLKEHPELSAVVCGGMGTDELFTEASVMGAFLEEGGVEPQRIHREEHSTDTEENLRNAKEIIRRETGKDNPRVLIVSNGFHLYRAGLICESLGMTPSYLAAPGSDQWYWELNYRIREFCGVVTWTLGFR